MILKKLNINGLFGHFNHEITFKDENITIITAPNGYGKTVCLKVIDAIFNKKLSYLCELQFKNITLATSKGTLIIKKQEEDSITLELKNENDVKTLKNSYKFRKKHSIHDIDVRVPFLHRIGPRDWMDHRTDEVYSFDEVIDKFSEYLPDEYTTKDYPTWFSEFTDSLNAHFIQDQRLIQRKIHSPHKMRREGFTDTIEKYADELSELIKQSGLRSSHVSQQLDTSFPERLLRKDTSFVAMQPEELKKELQELQEKRTVLSAFDLLSTAQHLPPIHYLLNEIKSEDTKVLTLYVQDTKEKLSSYDNIYKKIDLFSRILNNKRLSFKKIKIDSIKGFHFETDEKRPLKLTQLSSGEQHQVVLLYELIFKTEKNILVLIDEPEISLHVAWQKEFLKDLQEIIKIQNMPIVIATHSPQIIDSNWYLTVNLEEGID